MDDEGSGTVTAARTVLEFLLRTGDRTYPEQVDRFVTTARELGEPATLTVRHLRRLASGERTGTTPATRRVLQAMFGHPTELLLSPWHGQSLAGAGEVITERTMLTMAADRARRFQLETFGSNVNAETVDQLHDDVAQLCLNYQKHPLHQVVGDLVETQGTLFTLLEGKQPPAHTRHLLMLAGVSSGLLAKVSHDLADAATAMTHSRTAFLCAEQADHAGLKAWIRGLQSLICHWAGRHREAARFAEQGALFASRGTAGVWLPLSQARACAALGDRAGAVAAIARAELARGDVELDEIDELGGLCTFPAARQAYYAADALARIREEAGPAERYAEFAVQAYADTTAEDWAFGDAAGAATDLALARLWLGEVEGAQEAMRPVLSLPPEQRIQGVVKSAQAVHSALALTPGSPATEALQDEIEVFTATGLQALPRG